MKYNIPALNKGSKMSLYLCLDLSLYVFIHLVSCQVSKHKFQSCLICFSQRKSCALHKLFQFSGIGCRQRMVKLESYSFLSFKSVNNESLKGQNNNSRIANLNSLTSELSQHLAELAVNRLCTLFPPALYLPLILSHSCSAGRAVLIGNVISATHI